MTTVGNTDYKSIENRQYITTETEHAQEIISKLTQENIQFSGRYDDTKLTLNFSQKDWEKVSQILNDSAAPVPTPQQSEKEVQAQEEKQDSKALAKQSLEELQKQMQELQQEIELRQQRLEEQEKNAQTQKHSQQPEQFMTPEIGEPKPEKLLPILNAKVVQHAGKLESLAEKRAVLEDKISNNQAKLEALTARAVRLSDTNHMIKTLSQGTKIPGIRAMAEAVIQRNEQKIAKIQGEKIPAHLAKIQKHTRKIAGIDRNSAVTQCKIDRCRNISQLVKSFGIINNSQRRQQFSQAMDGLHQSTTQLLSYKIDSCNRKITALSQKYMETDSAVDKHKIHQKINAQKEKKQRLTAKSNQLQGVTTPYTKQPDIILDNIISKTERQVTEAMQSGKTSVPILAEQISIRNADFLPEVALSSPEKRPDQSLLPEIAGILNMSVSEIESKPQDIQMMLKDMYTANYFADPTTLQETLTCIINPNHETQRDLQEHQAEMRTAPASSERETDSNIRKQEHIQGLPQERAAATVDATTKNHLRSVEELSEANANMIDGILNNEKPEPGQDKTKKPGFTFSRSSMKALAAKVHDTPSNPPEKEKQREEMKH